MKNVITTTAPAPQEPDYRVLRQDLINSMGVNAYLESYSNYLKTQPLTTSQRFDMYYQTRTELKANN